MPGRLQTLIQSRISTDLVRPDLDTVAASVDDMQAFPLTPRAFMEIALPGETTTYRVFDPSAVQSEDRLQRTVTDGVGTADQGTMSVIGTAADFDVVPGHATVSNPTGNNDRFIAVTAPTWRKQDVIADISIPMPVGSTATFALHLRRVDANNLYRALLVINATGVVTLAIQSVIASTTITDIAAAATISGLTYTANKVIRVRMRAWDASATAVSPTQLQAKVWDPTGPEPVWQRTGTDSTAALQVAAGHGFHFRAGTGMTNVPFVWSLYPWVGLGS